MWTYVVACWLRSVETQDTVGAHIYFCVSLWCDKSSPVFQVNYSFEVLSCMPLYCDACVFASPWDSEQTSRSLRDRVLRVHSIGYACVITSDGQTYLLVGSRVRGTRSISILKNGHLSKNVNFEDFRAEEQLNHSPAPAAAAVLWEWIAVAGFLSQELVLKLGHTFFPFASILFCREVWKSWFIVASVSYIVRLLFIGFWLQHTATPRPQCEQFRTDSALISRLYSATVICVWGQQSIMPSLVTGVFRCFPCVLFVTCVKCRGGHGVNSDISAVNPDVRTQMCVFLLPVVAVLRFLSVGTINDTGWERSTYTVERLWK